MGVSNKSSSNRVDFSGCDLLSQEGHRDGRHDGENAQYRYQLQQGCTRLLMKMPIQKLDANLSEWQYPFFHLEQHEPVLPVLTYS